MKRVVLAALLALAAVGCSKPVPVDGKVVGKKFVPAHDEWGVVVIPDGNGGFNYIPVVDHIPDKWFLSVWCKDNVVRETQVGKDKFEGAREGDEYHEEKK